MKPEIIAKLKELDDAERQAKEENRLFHNAIWHGICPHCGRSITKSCDKGFWIFGSSYNVWQCPVHGVIHQVECLPEL